MSEMVLPQQQKLGSSEKQNSVDFDMLIAQILGTAQGEASDLGMSQLNNDGIVTDINVLLQLVSDLDIQKDQDQPMDIDAIMSQLSALFGEKVDQENIVHKMQELQPEKLEALKSNIQDILTKLENPKAPEEKALQEKLGQILEEVKTITSNTSNITNTTEAKIPNAEGLKEQSHLMTAVRNYKSQEQQKSQQQQKRNTNQTEIKSVALEIEKPERVITQNNHAVKINSKYDLEAEKLAKVAPLQPMQVEEISYTSEEKSSIESLKQPTVLSSQFQEVVNHKVYTNQNMEQTSELETTGLLSKAAEDSIQAIESNTKPEIAQNSLPKEDAAFQVHKNTEGFVKIQNIDKIYMALQKQVIQTSQKEKSTLTVKLQPEELGKMKIQLEMVEGVVKGMIVVENESAKQALQNHLQDMKNQIKDQDIALESLEVNVNSEAFSESNQSSDEENAFFNQRHTMRTAFDGEITENNAFIDKSTQTEQGLNLLA